MSIIIIEVPQRSPSIWVAKDEQHLIQMANEVNDFCYEEWNMENLLIVLVMKYPMNITKF